MDENLPPDDWDSNESFFKFVEQIDRGEWPVKVPLTVKLGIKNGRPSVLAAGDDSDDVPRAPEPPALSVTVSLDREKVRQIVLDVIESAARRGRSKLSGLALLARVDRECFLDSTARHFANLLRDTDETLRTDETLSEFLVDLHEWESELIGQCIERTAAVDRAAGDRLRSLILDAINEPPCRDELGLLAVAQLAERLEGE